MHLIEVALLPLGKGGCSLYSWVFFRHTVHTTTEPSEFHFPNMINIG